MSKAFVLLYEEHISMVYNLCLSYVQNTEDAEEIAQDVFVKVNANLENFGGQSSIKTWIYKITINQCLDFIKSKQRKKRSFLSSMFSGNENLSIPDFNHPGIQLEQKEAYEALFQKINHLPHQQKTALILKHVEGMTQKEVAEIMGTTQKAVESLLQRAKSNLKKKL